MTGALQIWRCDLDGEESRPDLLDRAERERASRFVFERDRRRYVVAHSFARMVLGRHVAADPASLVFKATSSGKPWLRDFERVQFNLSHSAGVGYLAIGDFGPVGIDCEVAKAVEGALRMAATVFSAGEVASLRPLSEPQLSASFLRCWTRKEAYVKAMGAGIVTDLPAIHVGIHPDPATVAPIIGVCDRAVHIRTLPHRGDEHVAVAAFEPFAMDNLTEFSFSTFQPEGRMSGGFT